MLTGEERSVAVTPRQTRRCYASVDEVQAMTTHQGGIMTCLLLRASRRRCTMIRLHAQVSEIRAYVGLRRDARRFAAGMC